MNTNNQINWNKPDIVASYARAEVLQPAEEKILDQIKDQLSSYAMLDIGIGGGRTSVHFAPRVKTYTGIDYAPNMVDACIKRFSKQWPRAEFHVCDVRSMKMFENGLFDFVLFSFNGISYIDHLGRIKALSEIRRVLKSGGIFSFSSHNYFSMQRFVKVPRCFHPIHLYRYIQRSRQAQALLSQKNGDGYAIIRDGAEGFRIETYYIKPSVQLDQLKAAGFGTIRAFQESDGQEIADLDRLNSLSKERWIYYVCKV